MNLYEKHAYGGFGVLDFPARGTVISGSCLGSKDVEFGEYDGETVLDLGAIEGLSSLVRSSPSRLHVKVGVKRRGGAFLNRRE